MTTVNLEVSETDIEWLLELTNNMEVGWGGRFRDRLRQAQIDLWDKNRPEEYDEMSDEEAQMYCDQEELYPEDFHPDKENS